MPDIMHLLAIDAPPERVYAALTTAEGIRQWWTRDATLNSTPGGIGEFGFCDGASATRVRVDELVPPAHVVWTTVASFRPEWIGTTIAFELRPQNGGTLLAFAQRGFAESDDVYALTTTGWGYYLVSLQHYLEAGTGAPHPDVDFARVLKR